MKQPLTAQQLLGILKQNNPDIRFATLVSGDAIAMWDEATKRYVTLLCKTVPNDAWVAVEGMEVLVNGQPMIAQHEWIAL